MLLMLKTQLVNQQLLPKQLVSMSLSQRINEMNFFFSIFFLSSRLSSYTLHLLFCVIFPSSWFLLLLLFFLIVEISGTIFAIKFTDCDLILAKRSQLSYAYRSLVYFATLDGHYCIHLYNNFRLFS